MDFSKSLAEQQIPLHGLFLNRVEPEVRAQLEGASLATNRMLEYHHGIHVEQKHWIGRFREALPQLSIFEIPRRGGALHDVPTLSRLGDFLLEYRQ